MLLREGTITRVAKNTQKDMAEEFGTMYNERDFQTFFADYKTAAASTRPQLMQLLYAMLSSCSIPYQPDQPIEYYQSLIQAEAQKENSVLSEEAFHQRIFDFLKKRRSHFASPKDFMTRTVNRMTEDTPAYAWKNESTRLRILKQFIKYGNCLSGIDKKLGGQGALKEHIRTKYHLKKLPDNETLLEHVTDEDIEELLNARLSECLQLRVNALQKAVLDCLNDRLGKAAAPELQATLAERARALIEQALIGDSSQDDGESDDEKPQARGRLSSLIVTTANNLLQSLLEQTSDKLPAEMFESLLPEITAPTESWKKASGQLDEALKNVLKVKYKLITLCDDLAKGYFRPGGGTRKALYLFAVVFRMTYHDDPEKKDPNSDVETELFQDYYQNNVLRILEEGYQRGSYSFERIPSGQGINFKDAAEVVYLYYLHRNSANLEIEPTQTFQSIKSMLAFLKTAPESKDVQKINGKDSNLWHTETMEALLKMDEQHFADFLRANHISTIRSDSLFAQQQKTAYRLYCQYRTKIRKLYLESGYFDQILANPKPSDTSDSTKASDTSDSAKASDTSDSAKASDTSNPPKASDAKTELAKQMAKLDNSPEYLLFRKFLRGESFEPPKYDNSTQHQGALRKKQISSSNKQAIDPVYLLTFALHEHGTELIVPGLAFRGMRMPEQPDEDTQVMLRLLDAVDDYMGVNYRNELAWLYITKPENMSRTALLVAYYYHYQLMITMTTMAGRYKDDLPPVNRKGFSDQQQQARRSYREHQSFAKVFARYQRDLDEALEKAGYTPISSKNLLDMLLVLSSYASANPF